MSSYRAKSTKNTTQEYLEIAEIKEDTVVLRDGSLRAVLLVSSINFALKSLEEQNAIIGAYMSFLNSFDFFLQIVVQSRKVDMRPYLSELMNLEKTQTNELLKMQTREYRDFIAELVELGDIMTKRFYVIVPYNPISDSKKSFWKRTKELFSSATIVHLEEKRFHDRNRELSLRVGHVMTGLNSISLQAIQLDTQALIELYYNSFNPESAVKRIADVSTLQVEEYSP